MSNKNTCAPGNATNEFKFTCYTLDALKQIAEAYNKHMGYKEIETNTNNKKQLWNAIKRHMSKFCKNEWCWIDQQFAKNIKYDIERKTFRPKIPQGKYQFLSTDDIDFVLKQYELLDATFHYLGTVPINFAQLSGNEVRTFPIQLESYLTKGIRKWGIVFNTDPAGQPGEHWIAMYIELISLSPIRKSSAKPLKTNMGTIDYFDSYGYEPPEQVQQLIKHIQEANPKYQFAVNINRKRHQFKNSECGVYAINFIVQRMLGNTFHKVTNNIIRDEIMNTKRKKYFRPLST